MYCTHSDFGDCLTLSFCLVLLPFYQKNLLNKYICFTIVSGSDDWEIPFENISDLEWLGSGAQGAVFVGR